MPYLGIFRLEFEKTIVIFEISSLEFLKNDASTHKKPLSYLKSAPSNLPNCKILQKNKNA